MNRHFVTMTLTGWMILSAAATTALAQDGSSISIMRDDSGATRVRHISMPNLEALRTPDFTRKDVPIFTERLILSEPQADAISQRIDAYVEAFIALTKDLATVAGPQAEFAPAAEGENVPGRPGMGGPGPMGGPGVAFDDLEAQLPPGSSVGVSMMIGMDDGGGDGDGEGGGGAAGAVPPQPSAQVEVGIETPNGEDVSPELLAKFQERANEMAKKMMEQVRAQQEARAAGAPAQAGDGGPAVLMTSPEDIEKHQAEMSAKIEEFLKAKAKLRATFVADAQSNLAPEQIERWPSLERALTRERSLPKGRISGESTDLEKVLAGQKLPESSMDALVAEIEAYELDLDAALKRRDAFLADANQGIDAAISSGDADKAISIAQKAADTRIAVRKVNQQHAKNIALKMAGEQGEAFHVAAMQAFYPRVYNPTRVQKMFLMIDELHGMPADAAAAVADMRKTYDSELVAMNDHIRQTIDREEPLERVRGLERLKRTMQGEETSPHGEPSITLPDDPIRDAIDKRSDMDDRYLKTVASMLPAEMASGLPKPRTHKGPITVRSGGSVGN